MVRYGYRHLFNVIWTTLCMCIVLFFGGVVHEYYAPLRLLPRCQPLASAPGRPWCFFTWIQFVGPHHGGASTVVVETKGIYWRPNPKLGSTSSTRPSISTVVIKGRQRTELCIYATCLVFRWIFLAFEKCKICLHFLRNVSLLSSHIWRNIAHVAHKTYGQGQTPWFKGAPLMGRRHVPARTYSSLILCIFAPLMRSA